MVSIKVVSIVTVKVDAIAVGTSGTRNRAVAASVGAIGVGKRKDVNIDIVQQIDNAAVGAGAQFINQMKH